MAETPSWERAYRSTQSLLGMNPDHVLVEYAELVPPGPILDLGSGEGRTLFFLAEMGHDIRAIDVSQTAVDRCNALAKDKDLKVAAEVGDIGEMDIPEGTYSLVIAGWVLNFFRRSQAERIVERIKAGLGEKGLVYVGVFSVDEPGHEKARRTLEQVEENTYYCPDRGSHIYYFHTAELLSLFSGLDLVHFSEGKKLDLQHSEPHYHGFLTYMGQRRESVTDGA